MSRQGLLYRTWMGTPDWVFRALGFALFATLIAFEIQDFVIQVGRTPGGFWPAFWKFGAYWESAKEGASSVYLPWGRLLYISTYILIALSFILRKRPLERASRAREIVIPLIGAYWPLLPLLVKHVWIALDPAGGAAFGRFMFDNRWHLDRFLVGAGLIIVGNALDVWAYAVLFRSISIVAEPRELKVTGPYRFVRHPVYLGQILAQGGIWLFIANRHWVWFLFYGCFVVFQLYRSKVEDEVLERAFGEQYRDWKRRTFWIF